MSTKKLGLKMTIEGAQAENESMIEISGVELVFADAGAGCDSEEGVRSFAATTTRVRVTPASSGTVVLTANYGVVSGDFLVGRFFSPAGSRLIVQALVNGDIVMRAIDADQEFNLSI